MARFFVSQHPTFGSYKQPVPFRIEASPYFWWWYALTLNTDYIAACASGGAGFEAVFRDFGDVRYDGNRHLAFCGWWRRRTNEHETQGEYLFAEPQSGQRVEVVATEEAAAEALTDDNRILISVPLDAQRRHIEKRLNTILKVNLQPKAARLVRSVKTSKARYSLHIPVVPGALKKSFDLFDARREAQERGELISNFELARRAGVKVREREKDDEINTEENYRRTVSATVSRYVKQAERMIENAGRGKFP